MRQFRCRKNIPVRNSISVGYSPVLFPDPDQFYSTPLTNMRKKSIKYIWSSGADKTLPFAVHLLELILGRNWFVKSKGSGLRIPWRQPMAVPNAPACVCVVRWEVGWLWGGIAYKIEACLSGCVHTHWWNVYLCFMRLRACGLCI